MNFSDLKTKPKILLGNMMPLALLAILGLISVSSINGLLETNKTVDNTSRVLSGAAAVLSSATDMETGMRGYLLAGREDFLAPYENGQKTTYEQIAALKEAVKDTPEQVARLEEAEKTLREWQSAVVEPMIGLRRAIGDAPTMNDMARRVGKAEGKVFFDKFRGQIRQFSDNERTLLNARRDEFATAKNGVIDNFKTVREASAAVNEGNEVIGAANQLLVYASDMERGLLNYIVTGDKAFLQPYNQGKNTIFFEMQFLQDSVGETPEQVDRLKAMEASLGAWVKEVADPAVKLRQAGPSAQVATLIGSAKAKSQLKDFRDLITQFTGVQAGIMGKSQVTAKQSAAAVSRLIETMQSNENAVNESFGIIAGMDSALAAAVDMETGMRGYLLSGRDEFLDPYRQGGETFFKQISALQEELSENAEQAQLIAEVGQTIKDWQEKVTEPTIALRTQIGDAKTMDDMADLVGEARGKQFFDKFRGLIADFSAEETATLDTQRSDAQATSDKTLMIIGVCVALGLLIGLGLAFVIGGGIAGPIGAMTDAMRRLADGDNSAEVPGVGRKDEIGDMADAVEVFKQNAIEAERLRTESAEQERRAEEEKRRATLQMADELESSVKGVVEAVSSAASQMTTTADTMSGTSAQTSDKAQVVASTSQEATHSAQSVAAAAEELSQSIKEIGRQVTAAANLAQNAYSEASRTNETVGELSNGAQKIGDVVGLITDIAEQTNLLALNATIEAARAGEAGKGFAVVASEVKNLANQTGKATDEISQQIAAMQSTTAQTVNAIETVVEAMTKINEVTGQIAAAVEQQNAATSEIAESIQQTASGTEKVSTDIITVNDAAQQSSQAAAQLKQVVGDLSQQSDTLRDELDGYLNRMRSAV